MNNINVQVLTSWCGRRGWERSWGRGARCSPGPSRWRGPPQPPPRPRGLRPPGSRWRTPIQCSAQPPASSVLSLEIAKAFLFTQKIITGPAARPRPVNSFIVVPLSSLWGSQVTRIWNMNVRTFSLHTSSDDTCRVATMRLSIMFSSGSVRGVSSRPVLCFHCCLYTLHTALLWSPHCTAASISPPLLCWHGTEGGWWGH